MVWKGSAFGRALVLGALVLLLQIPILRVAALVGEREESRAEAVAEVRASWGGEKVVQPPLLLVPYRDASSAWVAPGAGGTRRRFASVAPRELRVVGDVEVELRRRGIFEVPVYRTSLHFEGSFSPPDPVEIGVAAEDILWDEIRIAVVPDAGSPRSVRIGARDLPVEASDTEPYVTATVGRDLASRPIELSFDQRIEGSGPLSFEPSSGALVVELRSSWPHPKFVGAKLPESYAADRSGFTARWVVDSSTRPRLERRNHPELKAAAPPSFGVDLIEPVDAYRMVRRSLKYELLFTALTLGVFFSMEVFAGSRLHGMHYLLVGLALVLFYLLILSISEHIGFTAAYGIAALGVTTLVAVYASSLFDSGARAALLGALQAALYGFLYVLLSLQDYSLLVGSVGLFAALAAFMLLTRDVDWDQVGR